jgi:hypothetical protein
VHLGSPSGQSLLRKYIAITEKMRPVFSLDLWDYFHGQEVL